MRLRDIKPGFYLMEPSNSISPELVRVEEVKGPDKAPHRVVVTEFLVTGPRRFRVHHSRILHGQPTTNEKIIELIEKGESWATSKRATSSCC